MDDDRALRIGRAVLELLDALGIVAGGDDRRLTLEQAREICGFKSTRVLRAAINTGALVAFGTRRTRTVRRVDLHAWLESRRANPKPLKTDTNVSDLESRMREIELRSLSEKQRGSVL